MALNEKKCENSSLVVVRTLARYAGAVDAEGIERKTCNEDRPTLKRSEIGTKRDCEPDFEERPLFELTVDTSCWARVGMLPSAAAACA